VTTAVAVLQSILYRHIRLIQRGDGYGYSTSTGHALEMPFSATITIMASDPWPPNPEIQAGF
jgi:hypothetical protein